MRHKSIGTGVGLALAAVMFSAALLWNVSSSATTLPSSSVAKSLAANSSRDAVVVRIPFHSTSERDQLATKWGADEVNTLGGYITVTTDQLGYAKMKAAGVAAEVDKQASVQANIPTLWDNGGADPLTFYNGYKTVEEMIAFLDAEVAAHPGLAEKVDVGNTWCKDHLASCTYPAANGGYDMWALHITNQAIAGPKPVFWYDAGIHSREIATSEVAMRYADYLLSNYDTNADAHWLVDYQDIWVMPMLNSDGHHVVEQGGNSPYYQRKNVDSLLCSGYPESLGIDLNRNYDWTWNCCGGSSGAPCDETYHGPSAASESETQYVEAKIRTLIPDQRGPSDTDPAPITTTGVVMGMHSYANINLYAWGTTTTNAPNYTELDNLAAHMSAPNANPPGNNYDHCAPPVCLYSVDGDSIDWVYGELGAAAFTTELEGGSFFPSYSSVANIFNHNRGELLYLAKVARQPYLETRGPDTNAVGANPASVEQGATTHLTATINYNWGGSGYTNNYIQNVAAAEYYVDSPPWMGGTAVAMNGTFSGHTVNVDADISTASLSVGRHILFVRGRGVTDYSGYHSWGPVSAAFFTVTASLSTPTPLPATDTPVPATDTPSLPTATAALPTDTPLPIASPTDCPIPFVDISGNTFYNAIKYLYCRGVVNGTDGTHYSPAGTSTRAQFAKVAVLGFGIADYTPVTPDFTDVPANYFAYAYIEAGFHAGILSGFDAATCQNIGAQPPCYGPNRPITRAQLTKLVVGAAGYPAFTPTTPTFSDVLSNNVFYVSIETAHHMGIINGYPDNTFRPNNSIRRDEMAQIVYKGVTTPL